MSTNTKNLFDAVRMFAILTSAVALFITLLNASVTLPDQRNNYTRIKPG